LLEKSNDEITNVNEGNTKTTSVPGDTNTLDHNLTQNNCNKTATKNITNEPLNMAMKQLCNLNNLHKKTNTTRKNTKHKFIRNS
jgi:hypothetical protein